MLFSYQQRNKIFLFFSFSFSHAFLCYLIFFYVISGSLAAIVLLDSIDVGLETAHTDGLQDWDSVKVFITTICVI